jgi:cytochrome P450
LTTTAVLTSKLDFLINMASKHADIIAKEGTCTTGSRRDFRQFANDFAIDMWGEVMFEMKDAHLESDKLLALDEKVNRIIVNPLHILYHAIRSYLTFKCFDEPDHTEQEIYQEVKDIMDKRIGHLESFERRGEAVHNILRNVSIATGGDLNGALNQHAIDLARFNIYGGHHSIGLIITWLIYELNRNPEKYNRVGTEIRALLEDGGISGLNLKSLRTQTPYLDAAIKETMRIYPIVHATVRVVNRNCIISGTRGMTVPLTPGMVVYISFYHLHKAQEFWGHDAGQFRPERFLGGKPTEGQFMPFGLGTRACVGYEFPMLSIKVFLVLLLSRYSVDMQHVDQTIKFGAMLEPCEPFVFSVRKLEQMSAGY